MPATLLKTACISSYIHIIKTKITLSNALITTLQECLGEYRCMYCLESSGDFLGNFLPPGMICCNDCEQNFMNKFILPWSYSKHQVRALWIKHLDLKTLNNIGRAPTCNEHYNYKVCLADFISTLGLTTWLEDPDNNTKARNKRDRHNCAALGKQEFIKNMLQ